MSDEKINLDELTIKINRLDRFVQRAEQRMGQYENQLIKIQGKLKHDRDFAAQHLDGSATLRREV